MPIDYENDPRYLALVKEYSEDPEFLSFPEQDQDDILDQAYQKNYGVIPNSQELLNKAVSRAPSPFFKGSDIPKVGFQIGQGALYNAPQNILENPMDFARSGPAGVQFKTGAQLPTSIGSLMGMGKAVEPEQRASYLEPESMGGQIASGVGGLFAGGFPAGSTLPAKGLAKGVKSVFSTSLAKKKQSDVIWKSLKEVEKQVGEFFRERNKTFGDTLATIKSNLSGDDIAGIIDETVSDLSNPPYPGNSAYKLQKYAENLREVSKVGPNSTKVYDAESVNGISREILKILGPDEVAKVKFYDKYMKRLPEGVPGLEDLKASHKPTYEIAKMVEPLSKKSTLGRISSGSMGPDELGDLKIGQKRMGRFDVISGLEKAGKKVRSTQTAKKIGIGALGLGALGGAGSFIKNLFPRS